MISKRALGRFLISLICLPYLAFSQQPQALTLQQAEAIALKNHPQILSARYSALAAKQVTREVRSAYLPFAYGSMTGAGATPAASRVTAGGLNNPVIYNREADGITVGQLVTDFGRTKNLVASSRLNAEAASQNTQATRQDVLLRVASDYFNALQAQAVLKVAQETVSERQVVADQVTALAKSKLKSTLDVSFAEVNLAQAKLLEVQAQNNLKASHAQLSAALGYSKQQAFQLVEEPMPSPPPADPVPLIAQAFQNRPELAGMRLSSEAALKFAKAERDLWFPTVSFLGTTGLTPLRPAKLGNLTDHYAAAGINVNVPIFNGRMFSARRAEAQLKAQAENQNLRDLEDRIGRDVRVAWLNSQTAFQKLGLTEQLLKQANLALDLAQSRYKIGLGSIVELSQAQLNQTEAEIEQAGAKYDYQIAAATLNYQVGSTP